MTARNGHPLVSYQPLRLLFQLSYIVVIILRLPYYATISLVPFLRANRKWTAKQSFMTRIAYSMLDAVSRVGITETLSLNPGKEGKRFQTVPVSTSDVYKGPLASKTVKPATIGGTWYPDDPGSQVISKTIVLHFHGGAFVQGDGRTEQCGVVAKYFLDKGTADAVFCLQYRLSGHGGIDPFPAALQDALSSYLFLLQQCKIPPHQIIFAGDSSGANLTAALLRYLYEFGSTINIPTPKCAVLLSPWVDPFYLNPAGNPQRSTDFVPVSYGAWGAYAYAGSCPEPWANPYITHLGHPFPTPVPLFVNAGTSELFFEHITRWAVEMRGIEGNVVELHHEEDAVHDTYLIGQLIGFEESAWGVAAKVAEFVQNL
ncbi:hypothetical protein N7513_002173 [Penicillium frequentans]|nr:hypothetical protein N7513_002173 [Penicillium glabrum]